MVDGQEVWQCDGGWLPCRDSHGCGAGCALPGGVWPHPRWDLSILMLTASREPAGSVFSLPLEMESLLTAWGVRNSSREKCIAA